MDFLLSPATGLWGLFLSSLLAATILPGGSEAVLALVAGAHPEHWLAALLLATAGNTLGGMSTYAIGRMLPRKPASDGIPKVGAGGTADRAGRHARMLERFGPPTLLLAWTPVLGDALCAAAGWLRLAWLPCAIWMALGKGLRYAAILLALGWVLPA